MTVPTYDGSGANLLNTAGYRENIDTAIQGSSEFGPAAQLSADKALSQIVEPVADQLGQTSDALQESLDARDRDAAEGVHLDNLGALIGVIRQPATYSTVTLRLVGTPATVIAAGKRARVPGTTDVYWTPAADATIPGGGTIDVAGVCTVIGAQDAITGSITEIVDAVAGWTSVTNVGAAIAGDEIETDAAYRRRQRLSLSAGGTARPAAIRARIEALDAVTAAGVIENLTLVTDARGIPGKSYRPIVWPTGLSVTNEMLVINAIWEVTPAGIYVDGSERYDVTDDQGYVQNLGFEYGTQVEVYAILDLTVTSEYPSTGDADVEAALKVFDDDWTLGSKVLPDELTTYVRDQVPGIDNIVFKLKIGSAPGLTDIVPLYPDVDEVPHFDTNVTVNS
jgi:hypothetical protein